MLWDQPEKPPHTKILSIHGEKIEFQDDQAQVLLPLLLHDSLQQHLEPIPEEVYVSPHQCVELLDLNQVMEEIVGMELLLWPQASIVHEL